MESIVCIPFNNEALNFAAKHLSRCGITTTSLPHNDVTHLLLPVPSFDDSGHIRGGGSIEGLLRQFSESICVIGGNLSHIALRPYKTIDLLQDPHYVTQNAAITAYCALKYIINALPVVIAQQTILIIGWGRIGKCLSKLLRDMNAHVTILARKETDRAMATALGYHVCDADVDLSHFRVLINTAPASIFNADQLCKCRSDCYKLDLASIQGIPGPGVLWARGLPGKDAPESSGILIADTIMRLSIYKEVAP